MVDLKAKPYYLNDSQIEWVENTIKNMTVDEKIGQLFVHLTGSYEADDDELKYKVENGNLYYVELDHDKGWELWGAIVISGNQFELTEEEIEGSRKEVELKRYVRL